MIDEWNKLAYWRVTRDGPNGREFYGTDLRGNTLSVIWEGEHMASCFDRLHTAARYALQNGAGLEHVSYEFNKRHQKRNEVITEICPSCESETAGLSEFPLCTMCREQVYSADCEKESPELIPYIELYAGKED